MAMRVGLPLVFLCHAVVAIHYNHTDFLSPSAEVVEQAVRRAEQAVCGAPFSKWHNDTHYDIGRTLRYMQNQATPEQRDDVAEFLIEYVKWVEELDALHRRQQRFACDGKVLNERFLHAITCELMHGERCRHECETEVGRYRAESLEAQYGVQRCTTYAAHLSCTGAKLAEICGGRYTEFDMARLTLIEAQQSMIAVTRDKRQPSHCGAETVAAMYKLIFMKAPKGTEDIFGL